MKEPILKQIKIFSPIILVVGIIIFIPVACMSADTPSIVSIQFTTATQTEPKSCTCTGKNGNRTGKGFISVYTFEYNEMVYSGKENVCSCAFVDSEAGKPISVVFDKDNPTINLTLGDYLNRSIFTLVGLFFIVISLAAMILYREPKRNKYDDIA